jgi:regulator of RNase E activity RraA
MTQAPPAEPASAPLTADDLAQLSALDTPTVCNALEIVAPERRGFGYTTQHLHCAFPDLSPMVGYARTARIRAATPPSSPRAELRRRQGDYYDYVGAGARPTIGVIQDLDGARAGYGAFWGEVNSTIHRALGCLGVVTNGSVRDLHLIAPGFQLLSGSVSPSHAFAHLLDFDGEVVVAGMVVRPGDLIHADRHGAVVVPLAAARPLLAAAALCARREQVILDACASPDFRIELLRKAMGDSDQIH